MDKFEIFLPTQLIFGEGESEKIGKTTAAYGKKVLLVTGKGSVRKTGLYDRVVGLLKTEGLEIFELQGIDPNPRLSSCIEGAEICKKNGIEVVLAVGGGSVLDAAKTIAVGALDDGDLWDFFLCKREVVKALPLVTMITLAATGSEYNVNSVILNEETGQKYSIHSVHVYPRVSILDPALTVTVPVNQTVFGSIDILSHALEGYVTAHGRDPFSERMTEGLFKTVMECAEKAVENPGDMVARGALMWAGTVACSGLAGVGYGEQYFDGHTVEHEFSAAFDITHGAGLSIILPGIMKYNMKEHLPKLVQFAMRVFGIERSWFDEDEKIALKGIEAFKNWCKKMGAPVTLKEIGVKKEELEYYACRIMRNPEASNLSRENILDILNYSYE